MPFDKTDGLNNNFITGFVCFYSEIFKIKLNPSKQVLLTGDKGSLFHFQRTILY